MSQVGPAEVDHSSLGQINDTALKRDTSRIWRDWQRKRGLRSARSR